MLKSYFLLLLLLVVFYKQQGFAYGAQEEKADDKNLDSADEEQTLKLDPTVIRDAIASVLRSSDGHSENSQDDGYAEAAQEYLEHVQTVLASAASPSELYIREQLADLDTLSQLLAQLSRRSLNKKSALRLSARLLKGPAKELILPTLTGSESELAYPSSDTAKRLSDAAQKLRNFLSDSEGDGAKGVDSVAERLKGHAEKVEAGGPVREFLDGVLDRMLELEGKKVRFNVEFPDAKSEGDTSNPSFGEARVSRLPDDQDEQDDEDSKDSSRYSSSSSTKKSTSSTEDDGGRNLFDQVLCRRAAESVAAALAKDGDNSSSDDVDGDKSSSVRLRIQELRRRQYQPAGLEAMLEAIEDCL